LIDVEREARSIRLISAILKGRGEEVEMTSDVEEEVVVEEGSGGGGDDDDSNDDDGGKDDDDKEEEEDDDISEDAAVNEGSAYRL
jgi:hypothetical protein